MERMNALNLINRLNKIHGWDVKEYQIIGDCLIFETTRPDGVNITHIIDLYTGAHNNAVSDGLKSETLFNFCDEVVTIQERPDGTTAATYDDENGDHVAKVYNIDFADVVGRWYNLGWRF